MCSAAPLACALCHIFHHMHTAAKHSLRRRRRVLCVAGAALLHELRRVGGGRKGGRRRHACGRIGLEVVSMAAVLHFSLSNEISWPTVSSAEPDQLLYYRWRRIAVGAHVLRDFTSSPALDPTSANLISNILVSPVDPRHGDPPLRVPLFELLLQKHQSTYVPDVMRSAACDDG